MEITRKNDASESRYHFVTGRLAEFSLRKVVDELSTKLGFEYTIGVMPITVAALMTSKWLKRHLNAPQGTTEVILPGYCERDLEELRSWIDVPVRCGPKDLRELPEFFSLSRKKSEFSDFDIEIIAEINHAPDHSLEQLRAIAADYAACGADTIDLGCNPGSRWHGVTDAVQMLRDEGLRVSIDTLDPVEAAQACAGGAELVLSVNSSNREAAADWGSEVVVIPDNPLDMDSLHATVEYLAERQVELRIDPILEPIGCGFAASLGRYINTRMRYPDAAMMMGIGNLSELTDVDSAGVNMLLLGICQELRIQSVLTTEVINWARSSIRECDIARRLIFQAVSDNVPPKNMSDQLITLRDTRLTAYDEPSLQKLARQIKDNNYRLFAQDDQIHLITAQLHLSDSDPFQLFADLMQLPQSANVDASHAFYLGFEMAKALTALTLGKQYDQDKALNWGYLTRDERHRRLNRQRKPKES